HQVAVHIPHAPMALLVEVHPHGQWLAQLPAQFHKVLPRRVIAEDITHYQFPARTPGRFGYPLRSFDGVCQWLLDEYVAAMFHRRDCIFLVGVWISGYADRIGPGGLQRLFVIAVKGVASTQ